MRALRHPPLGLVLALAAAIGLPSQVRQLVGMLTVYPADAEMWALTCAMLGCGVFQLATGIAVMRGRSATLLFALFTLSSAALVTIVGLAMRGDDDGSAMFVGLALETLAVPLVVVVGSAFAGLRGTRARGDVGALLLISGITTWLATPHHLIDTVRMMTASYPRSIGSWIGALLHPVIGLGLAAMTIVAGLCLLGGPAARARRWLRIYVFGSIAIHGILGVLGIISVLFIENDMPGYVVAVTITGALFVPLIPAVIWFYAHDLVDEEASGDAVAAPAWVVLVYVPLLISKLFIAEMLLTAVSGSIVVVLLALCAAQAGLITIAARSALRGRDTGTLLAAVLGLALYVAFVVLTYTEIGEERLQSMRPVAMLAVATATVAWLARRRS